MAALALFFFFRDGLPVTAVSAEVYRLISSPTLPAIPLLTACGYVLAESQASLRLLRFFKALLGWLPGGLAVIVIAVCALFTPALSPCPSPPLARGRGETSYRGAGAPFSPREAGRGPG